MHPNQQQIVETQNFKRKFEIIKQAQECILEDNASFFLLFNKY